MGTINRNEPPSMAEIAFFQESIPFSCPKAFIDFYRNANGADISSDEYYVILWPLMEMIQLNKDYEVEIYAPGFFLFGSNGGDAGFAIEQATGRIFEIPFIDLSKEESIFVADSFDAFLKLVTGAEKTIKVNIEDLGKVALLLLSKLQAHMGNEIELSSDSYWDIAADELHNPYEQPVHLALGQLSDDMQVLQRCNDSDGAVVYDLKRLAAVLTALSVENPTAF